VFATIDDSPVMSGFKFTKFSEIFGCYGAVEDAFAASVASTPSSDTSSKFSIVQWPIRESKESEIATGTTREGLWFVEPVVAEESSQGLLRRE
jgi:hypothetical protein